VNAAPAPAVVLTGASVALDVEAVRRDFPVLTREVHGKPLCYLDSAASSQRPRVVIEAIARYYETTHANVHRGIHTLSQESTELYEGAREKVRRFVNARSAREIVFVRGTTEAINLVAQSYARPRLEPGDEILISWLEHHSNIVPWQLLCEQTGARLRVIPITRSGEVDFDAFLGLLTDRTRFLALAHVSNALGTIVPVQRFIREARRRGIPVLLDGAQAAPHLNVDVRKLDCDFYCFSGHKMCGPTGVGVLYAKREHWEAMPPLMGGGSMVLRVDRNGTEWNEVPWKFEAGTPPIAQAIGLGAAVDYLGQLDWSALRAHEKRLTEHAHRLLAEVGGVRLLGPSAEPKGGIISFIVEGVHPHDLAHILDRAGVAIRAGHHCAMPLHERLGVAASARASLYLYNTAAEIDRLAEAVSEAKRVLRRCRVGRSPSDV
jgi:cysteine desulfurase/selenocysteine lyase